ncbi:phosphatase PAP2 family protein [Candidatus Berkiella aquae]|uniref:PAP2 superfamily protein n=1 Tax=Candidatus Berkiella aquae TaxID=295108 RepID=A0A0Q9YMI6_9GAMM|nr:phosphatase PAP2 family protein [Candidatus Berkiella aquae]MCS5710322.1 phosphatase PAP2 family protein [Candidatus Berkiella aquae]
MSSLPSFTHTTRLRLIVLGCSFFALIYSGIGGHPIREVMQAPMIGLDTQIPWLPWTVIIYLSQYVFLLLAVLYSPNQRIATQTYYGYLLATLLAGCIFILYPTQLPRVFLPQQDTHLVIYYLYQFLYFSDTPYNCFPSLHTTLALFALISLKQRNAFWQIVAPLWGFAIILSTLTTKQHCLLDVLAGMLLFLLCIGLYQKVFDERVNGAIASQNYTDTTVRS